MNDERQHLALFIFDLSSEGGEQRRITLIASHAGSVDLPGQKMDSLDIGSKAEPEIPCRPGLS